MATASGTGQSVGVLGSLAGVRVLDCSDGIAGPLAAMFLADAGADVVKVEPPGGAVGRSDPGFAVWNRGKRGVIADLTAASGRERVLALIDRADVVVASAALDALVGTVLEPKATLSRNAALVYLHTPPYAESMPWAGAAESDALLSALTGVALRQASFDDVPVDSIYPHVVTVQGIWAAAAAVAAFFERQRSGIGQVVTVGGVHGAMVAAAAAFTFDAAAGEAVRGVGGPGGSVSFYRTYQCADGKWLFLAALTPHFSATAFATIGLPDLLDDERLDGRGRAALLQPEHARWAIDRIAGVFRSRPRDEWLDLLGAAGCPAGPLLERDDWLDHPQIGAIGMRVEIDDPDRGPTVMPGIPIHLTGSPSTVRAPAPARGSDELVEWSQRSALGDEPRAIPVADGPLSGIRVLDLGAIIAGPFAGSLLAELGADVIKVEPLTGDSYRGPGFAAYNKGQRGVALDLRHPAGHRAFLALVRTADVVIDNYRPGVVGRLGIGYDALREVNPGIITLSITGFGEGGPLSSEGGFDPVLQAMSGMMAAQGGDSDPVVFTVPINDVAAASSAALGVCLALVNRSRTGDGQRVWTSLAAMSAFVQAGEIVRWGGRPDSPRGGRDHPGPSPLDGYHRVADGWLRAHASAADASLVAGLATMTRTEAVAALTRAGVPAAPARPVSELARDPEMLAWQVLQPDPRPGRVGWWTAGRYARFSRTERTGRVVAPRLGEHTTQVLAEVGLSPAEIEELAGGGAFDAGPGTR